jgi:transcriptional regulator with XRE-family HTH domain
MSQLNPATPAGLAARFRENVRLIKALRKMSDEDIAVSGGYKSRQVFSSRLAGRTPPGIDDIARIAAALRVEPKILLGPLDEATAWITENPTYKAPKVPASTRTRVHRKNEPVPPTTVAPTTKGVR